MEMFLYDLLCFWWGFIFLRYSRHAQLHSTWKTFTFDWNTFQGILSSRKSDIQSNSTHISVVKEALCGPREEIQTPNFNIYSINEVNIYLFFPQMN